MHHDTFSTSSLLCTLPDVHATIRRLHHWQAGALAHRWRSETARKTQKRLAGTIAVVGAATADPMIAEECRAVADTMG